MSNKSESTKQFSTLWINVQIPINLCWPSNWIRIYLPDKCVVNLFYNIFYYWILGRRLLDLHGNHGHQSGQILQIRLRCWIPNYSRYLFNNLDKNYEFYKIIKKIAIQLLKTFYFRARYLSNYLLCSPRPQLPERRAQNHTSRRQTVQYIGKSDFFHLFLHTQVT